LNVGPHQREPLCIDQVGFGERDNDTWNLQQLEDQEMFSSLGHDAFIGGNHEQAEVDPGCPDEHAANKVFVAGNVDDANNPDAIQR
jgi:hypothetical protein